MREAERLAAQAIAYEQQATELDELLGRASQLRLGLPHDGVSGQQLRDAAVEILVRQRGTGVPIHYREWFQLVSETGLNVGGRDPLATFLTQITRSPVVEQAGEPRSGLYLL